MNPEILPEHLPRTSSVLILQVDTRELPSHLKNWPHLDSSQVNLLKRPFVVSPTVNRAYACRHSYDYRLIRPYSGITGQTLEESLLRLCMHVPAHKERSIAWCKVVGLAYGLSLGYEYVVFLDMDAIFVDHELSLQSFLRKNEGNAIENPYTGRKGPLLSEAWLIMSPDWNKRLIKELNTLMNAGVIIVRNGWNGQELLKYWWNVAKDLKWNTVYDREQHVLSNFVYANERYGQRIARLPLGVFNGAEGKWITHCSAWRKELFKQLFMQLEDQGVMPYNYSQCSDPWEEKMNATEISLKYLSENV